MQITYNLCSVSLNFYWIIIFHLKIMSVKNNIYKACWKFNGMILTYEICILFCLYIQLFSIIDTLLSKFLWTFKKNILFSIAPSCTYKKYQISNFFCTSSQCINIHILHHEISINGRKKYFLSDMIFFTECKFLIFVSIYTYIYIYIYI